MAVAPVPKPGKDPSSFEGYRPITLFPALLKVLDKLLQVDCHIGLQPDGYGRTALHIALEQGKYALLRVMLRALLRRRFTVVPSTMGYVSGCFATLAAKYPRDFLHLISHMPLQEEPGHGRTGTARPLAVQRLATTAAVSS